MYGNLSAANTHRLSTAPAWQGFVLNEVMESCCRDAAAASPKAARHREQVDVAFSALSAMSEEEAREVEPDVLRVLLRQCHDALPAERLEVLEACCAAVQAHEDLLVTLQYHAGCRAAVTQLLDACAAEASRDSATFLRWLAVQRKLCIHTSEGEAGAALHNSALEGVYLGESVDEAEWRPYAEDLLTA